MPDSKHQNWVSSTWWWCIFLIVYIWSSTSILVNTHLQRWWNNVLTQGYQHLTITTDLFTLIIMFMRNHVTRHSFIWVIITYFAKFLRTIKRDDSVWNGGNSIPNLSNFPEQCKKNEVFCKISPSPDILRHTVVFSNIIWPLNCHRNGAIKGL